MKYWELIEQLKDIYTELSYNSRFMRVAMFHLIGKTLIENQELLKGKMEKISIYIGVSPEDLGIAMLFAQQYPNLDDYNHDKTISWDQIKHQYAQNKETQTK